MLAGPHPRSPHSRLRARSAAGAPRPALCSAGHDDDVVVALDSAALDGLQQLANRADRGRRQTGSAVLELEAPADNRPDEQALRIDGERADARIVALPGGALKQELLDVRRIER